MRKVIGFYNKAKDALTRVGSDKYLHVIFGLIAAFLTATASHAATGEARWSGALVGVVVAFILGFLKETADVLAADGGPNNGTFEPADWLATIVGGAVGAGLFILGS